MKRMKNYNYSCHYCGKFFDDCEDFWFQSASTQWCIDGCIDAFLDENDFEDDRSNTLRLFRSNEGYGR